MMVEEEAVAEIDIDGVPPASDGFVDGVPEFDGDARFDGVVDGYFDSEGESEREMPTVEFAVGVLEGVRVPVRDAVSDGVGVCDGLSGAVCEADAPSVTDFVGV